MVKLISTSAVIGAILVFSAASALAAPGWEDPSYSQQAQDQRWNEDTQYDYSWTAPPAPEGRAAAAAASDTDKVMPVENPADSYLPYMLPAG